jgi:integrase
MRGDGRIFNRKNSAVWWLAYYVRGKEVRESTGSPDRKLAERVLKQRRKEIGADQLGLKTFVGPAQERVTVEELLQDLETDYQVRGRKSVPELRGHLKAVRAAFGDWRALDVTPARIRQVIAEWQAESSANATVNRRLAALQRAFALAVEAGKLSTAPRFPTLKEDNARQGFWERGEFLALLAHTPDPDLRDFYEWAYWTGMRKGEIGSLTWATFDRETWTLRLHARDAKTGKGRVLALEGPLRTVIERRMKARRLDCPLIFHRDGQPIREFRKAWASACKAAGLTGKLFHDLRRTGVRNLVRAEVPQSVAMAISGHRTASVFRRYDITSEQDLRDAVRKVTAYVESLPTTATVTPLAKAAEARVR